MPALQWIVYWLLAVAVVILIMRGRGKAHDLSEKDDQIKTLSSLLQASLPGGLVMHVEAEIKRAGEEIDEAKVRKDLAHEAFFGGYRSALRNILITIRGWI
jgi:hypothetical protein